MKTRFFFATLFILLGGSVSAQDMIHTMDGCVIEAEVLEIGERDILYKAFDNPDGPDYRLSTARVAYIVFENGTRQDFTRAVPLLPGPWPDYYEEDPYELEYRWGGYYCNHRRISGQTLADYIGYSLYGGDYRRAKSQFIWGYSLTSLGLAAVVTTLVVQLMEEDSERFMRENMTMLKSDSSSSPAGYIAGYAIGAACLGAGIPLWVSGNRKLGRIADDYNRNYGRSRPGYGASVTVGPTASGVGLAFNF